uniref:Fatty acid desaturase domain-containing protein n=1 Tax=Solanum lycopersicum TaxID=4081 RepID=A0A3Q7J8Q6_SOLLC
MESLPTFFNKHQVVFFRLKKQDNDISSDKTEQNKNRVSFSKFPFTIGDIKKFIPPHCFQRSLVRSFSYLVQDLIPVSIFYYIATIYFHLLTSPCCYLAWPIYSIELGHQTYHRHHSNTSSLEYDEVYVPRIKSQVTWLTKYLNKNPLGRVSGLATTLNLGWPLYLNFNASGRPYPCFASHYHPHGPSYYDRDRLQIYISNGGVIATTYVLYHIALAQGLTWLVCIYGVPLQIMNIFIVLITLLKNTYSSLPHYDSSERDWLRGALATIDRDFCVLNKVFHHIPDAHVLHHLFLKIPHYHSPEANIAIKTLLGEYYQFNSTPFYKAFCRDYKECIYVEKDESSKESGIFWYKNEMN